MPVTPVRNAERLAGSLSIVSFEGSEWNQGLEELFHRYAPAGVIHFKPNIADTDEAVQALNHKLHETGMETSGLPPFITVDEEGGRVSRLRGLIGEYPAARELGRRGTQAVYHSYYEMAAKVRGLGFNLAWAPVADVDSNPANPVIGDRAFADNPQDVSLCVSSAIRGMQDAGLLTCAKHFPGHGDTSVDSHYGLPVQETDMDTLRQRELPPFRAAAQAGADMMMTAHILFPALDKEYPATFSPAALGNLLRNEAGFNGLAVTDDLSMLAVKEGFSLKERITLPLQAGADLLLIRDDADGIEEYLATFAKLIADGTLAMDVIKKAVERVDGLRRRMVMV